MRPLAKPDLSEYLDRFSASALLLQSLGPYCSFCERPIPAENYVWSKRTGTARNTNRPVEWPDLLPVCHNCRAAASRNRVPFQVVYGASMLFPDGRVPSFMLGDASPLVYQLRNVEVVTLSYSGRVLRRRNEDLVIVAGTRDETQSAVFHFALNTRHFDPAGPRLWRTRFAARGCADRRVEQRTAIWHQATRLAALVKETDSDDRPRLIDQARLVIAAAGFWSTWATVLWNELGPDERYTIQRLLTPERELGPGAGPGPHNTFPSTRLDWLPRA